MCSLSGDVLLWLRWNIGKEAEAGRQSIGCSCFICVDTLNGILQSILLSTIKAFLFWQDSLQSGFGNEAAHFAGFDKRG